MIKKYVISLDRYLLIENKYNFVKNTTIHNRNERLDFGLRKECELSYFNFGVTKFRIVKMTYLSTFLWAFVLFGLIVLWSVVEFFIESRKKKEISI
ncbi:hypothetical protein B9T36_09850 [Acinetobacter sp. ANC 4204]|nr:hypothetical protein B9T36_09850 [Acinetobacter sp. ANC 4204]